MDGRSIVALRAELMLVQGMLREAEQVLLVVGYPAGQL
jgi:hypothetical protein